MKRLFLLIYVLGLLSNVSHAHEPVEPKWIEVHSYEEIALALAVYGLNDDAWVIFDVDNTLLWPKDGILVGSHQWGNYQKQRFTNNGMNETLANAIKDLRIAEVQPYADVRPTDSNMARLLSLIDQSGAARFGLTARIELSRQATRFQFSEIGISFAGRGPKLEGLPFPEDGIEIAGARNKGDFVIDDLRRAVQKPKVIFDIDDRPYNLQAISDSVDQFNGETGKYTTFIGLRLTAADKRFLQFNDPNNAKYADLQYRLFRRWKGKADIPTVAQLQNWLELYGLAQLITPGPLSRALAKEVGTSQVNRWQAYLACQGLLTP